MADEGVSVSMVRRRGWWAWLVVAVLGLSVAGCSKPVPTEAEIVGTWVGESPDGWGEPGGTMVFNADGTFTAHGVPEGLLMVKVDEPTHMEGEGTWSVDDGSLDHAPSYFEPGIEIVYPGEPPSVNHQRLVFANSRGTLTLTYWNDYDLPERYVLVKED